MKDDEQTPTTLPAPLLAIPPIGDPVEVPAQPERPIADGTLPAPDLVDGSRTAAGHPRDDADRTRGEIVAESIAQHADHVIGARLGPLMERAVRVRALDDDLIKANEAAEQIETQPGESPPATPEGWRGRMSARMAAGGGLLLLFFAVGIAEALFAYDGFRELARFRSTDPAILREGAPALSAIVIALLIAVGQKAAGKNLRLAHTREPAPEEEGGSRLIERDQSTAARYAVAFAIIVCGLALWYGVQSARTTANNAAAARASRPTRPPARAAPRRSGWRTNTQPSASAPGVYFLVSSAVFLLGIGVAYLLVDPAREAKERRRRRDADTLALPRPHPRAARVGGRRARRPARGDRDDRRERQAPDAPGGGAASRGRVPAARGRVPAALRHVAHPQRVAVSVDARGRRGAPRAGRSRARQRPDRARTSSPTSTRSSPSCWAATWRKPQSRVQSP